MFTHTHRQEIRRAWIDILALGRATPPTAFKANPDDVVRRIIRYKSVYIRKGAFSGDLKIPYESSPKIRNDMGIISKNQMTPRICDICLRTHIDKDFGRRGSTFHHSVNLENCRGELYALEALRRHGVLGREGYGTLEPQVDHPRHG